MNIMKRKIEEQNSSDYFDAYGNAFSLYRKDENKFEKFISYFEERFKANSPKPILPIWG
jgi:hypothetical protein